MPQTTSLHTLKTLLQRPASAAPTLITVPLADILPDPRQPRRYLPPDLRDGRVPQAVLGALVERAGAGDDIAAAYLAELRGLAESIRTVGLRQPLQVAQERARDGGFRYRLIDGERRFWALWLLTAEDPARAEAVPVLLEPESSTGDDVLRAQWVLNLQREDVPALDFAEFVWQVRERQAGRMQSDPARYAAERDARLTEAEQLIELTSREVAHITGRACSARTIYRYCIVVEKLCDDAKTVARARGLSLRQLEHLARQPVPQQPALARALRVEQDEDVANSVATRGDGEGVVSPAGGKPGRPPVVDSRINLLVRVATDVTAEKESTLSRADATKLQQLHQAAGDAIASLQAYRQLIEKHLAG